MPGGRGGCCACMAVRGRAQGARRVATGHLLPTKDRPGVVVVVGAVCGRWAPPRPEEGRRRACAEEGERSRDASLGLSPHPLLLTNP